MPQITILVEFETLEGRGAEFRQIMSDHARRTQIEEPGCVRFDVLEPFEIDGADVSERLLLVEVYADEDAIAAHERNPRLAQVREATKPLIKSRRRVVARQTAVELAEEGLTPDQLNAANDG